MEYLKIYSERLESEEYQGTLISRRVASRRPQNEKNYETAEGDRFFEQTVPRIRTETGRKNVTLKIDCKSCAWLSDCWTQQSVDRRNFIRSQGVITQTKWRTIFQLYPRLWTSDLAGANHSIYRHTLCESASDLSSRLVFNGMLNDPPRYDRIGWPNWFSTCMLLRRMSIKPWGNVLSHLKHLDVIFNEADE